jgi:hypothetical protein
MIGEPQPNPGLQKPPRRTPRSRPRPRRQASASSPGHPGLRPPGARRAQWDVRRWVETHSRPFSCPEGRLRALRGDLSRVRPPIVGVCDSPGVPRSVPVWLDLALTGHPTGNADSSLTKVPNPGINFQNGRGREALTQNREIYPQVTWAARPLGNRGHPRSCLDLGIFPTAVPSGPHGAACFPCPDLLKGPSACSSEPHQNCTTGSRS